MTTTLTSKEIFAWGRDIKRTAEETAAHPAFSHVTHRRWCGCDGITAYFRAADSPSGVVAAAGWSAHDEPSTLAYNHAREVFKTIYAGPTRGDIAARRWS